jgi:hypothetical protein
VGGSGNYNVNYFMQILIDTVNAHPAMIDFTPAGFFLDVESGGQVLTDVEVRNTTGPALEVAGSSGGGAITNVGVIGDGSFNPALMQYTLIGLNLDIWPWPAP